MSTLCIFFPLSDLYLASWTPGTFLTDCLFPELASSPGKSIISPLFIASSKLCTRIPIKLQCAFNKRVE